MKTEKEKKIGGGSYGKEALQKQTGSVAENVAAEAAGSRETGNNYGKQVADNKPD